MKNKVLTVGDLFCGAGGVTQGIAQSKYAQVIFCINHDALAIRSHATNHPDCIHYTEDIKTFDEHQLPKVDILWASVECTHFSKAKGGESREEDSRTLAKQLYRYIEHCNPKYVIVENVREFLTWAPLVQKKDKKGNLIFKKNGKPHMIPDTDKEKKGQDYRDWVWTIEAMGYDYDYRLLNSADFGAFTSRTRYFGVFAKNGLPIVFPTPTHTKKPKKGSKLLKWNPVKEKLDFSDKGDSIFERHRFKKKDLVEKTLERIYAGLCKFVVSDEHSWILKYLSNNAQTGINKGNTIENPLSTITTHVRMNLVQAEFIDKYYGNSNCKSVNEPCDTITTKDVFSLVQVESNEFIVNQYSSGGQLTDLKCPCPSVTTNPKQNLVQIEKGFDFLGDFQYNNKGHSLDKPHPVILASKKYTYYVNGEAGNSKISDIKETDSYWTVKIKQFMQVFGISDIKMRMLRPDELLEIQGFPKDYVLLGSDTHKKKFIGNSVPPVIAEKIINTLVEVYNGQCYQIQIFKNIA